MSQHDRSTASKVPDDSLPLEHVVGWAVTPLLKSRQHRSIPARTGSHQFRSLSSPSKERACGVPNVDAVRLVFAAIRLRRREADVAAPQHEIRQLQSKREGGEKQIDGNAPSLMQSTRTSTKENWQLSCTQGSETAAAGCA